MSITSEKVLLKMNEIQSNGGEPIGHWHQLRSWLLEDEQLQENFFEAVANDPDMTAEQKNYWLEKNTELEEYKQLYNDAAKLLNTANHKLSQIKDLLDAYTKQISQVQSIRDLQHPGDC